MIRCNKTGIFSLDLHDDRDRKLLTLNVSSSEIKSSYLLSWKPKFPTYLSDLRDKNSSKNSNCRVEFGFNDINNRKFDGLHVEHTVALGDVIERHIKGNNEHTYHQHTFPFQIIRGFEESEYFKYGDWHDTWLDTNINHIYSIMRYNALTFTGNLMIHCHILEHEDLGMMTIDRITSEGKSNCSSLRYTSSPKDLIQVSDENPYSFLLWSLILLGVFVLVSACIFSIKWFKYKNKKVNDGNELEDLT